MKRVYIAGPYTKGDVAVNVRTAIDAGDRLAKLGFAPFIPHLFHFWHLVEPHEYEFWMKLDEEWLRVCDAVLRLPGESTGADAEVALADRLGIPVFNDLSHLVVYLRDSIRRNHTPLTVGAAP